MYCMCTMCQEHRRPPAVCPTPVALLCQWVSIRLFLQLSCDPSIISISPWRAVLFRLIASPAPVLSASTPTPSPLCCSHSIKHNPAPPLTPSRYLSLTSSCFSYLCNCHSLLHPVSFFLSSSCIMPSLISSPYSTSCWAFIIRYTPLCLTCVSSPVLCVPIFLCISQTSVFVAVCAVSI